MAKIFNSNSQLPSSTPSFMRRTAKPSSDFYSTFSEQEVLGIIHALETRREIPLKYSYKGRGAKTWNNFYLQYIIPKWYRTASLEIDLLRKNFDYINGSVQTCEKVNVLDVGSGNSYPVKDFIGRLNKLNRINKYIALDISEELLNLSKANLKKWFPQIEIISYPVDIENSCLTKILKNQTDLENDDDTAKIILHLGVTIGNHQNRDKVLKNFRNSMNKNDLLVFTNETGSNSKWDGRVRGGLKYHAREVYAWIKNNIGIRTEDCKLVRKYDSKTDSIVANMEINRDYTIKFNFMGIDKNLEIPEGEEITIWRHHKYEIPELRQEIERAGLQLVHYGTDKYLSHVMVICNVASN